jgi:2-hydroxy-6-oxonona-2,4-dienedioate hydrolase
MTVAVSKTQHEQHQVTVLGGLSVRYIDVGAGTGKPPLLLLHGLASRIEEYEALITPLAEKNRVIVLDLPGNGYTDKPDRRYTLAYCEDAALAVLDHLKIDRANVAGGSLGGNLTLRLGLREPHRFAKLAAWAPAGAWKPHHIWPRLLKLLPDRLLFWPLLRIQSRFWYRRDWEGRQQALDSAFAHFREVYCNGFMRMYYDLGFEQITTSLYPVAPKIAQPTLLLWGDQDNGLDMGTGIKRLKELIPGSKLVVFGGARHSLANEVPGPLAEAIDSFLA